MLQPSLFHDYPSRVRRTVLAVALLAILGTIGHRIVTIVTPPPLVVQTPEDRFSTASRIVTIAGTTAPGAVLTINGSEIVPDGTGIFSTDVVLTPGANTIDIAARRRHSWSAKIQRRIYVHAANAPLA
ncbi:hypothetical protein HY632_02850 [Candidatus Uhrbacteria bacterium]|nr:hypothetical protein [Candidatus Uhrbacteria bacterium]